MVLTLLRPSFKYFHCKTVRHGQAQWNSIYGFLLVKIGICLNQIKLLAYCNNFLQSGLTIYFQILVLVHGLLVDFTFAILQEQLEINNEQQLTRLKSKVFSLEILILLIWTDVPRTNVAWTNVVVTVVICCVSKVSIPNLSLLVSLEVA